MITDVTGEIDIQKAAIEAQQKFQEKLDGVKIATDTAMEFAQVGVTAFSSLAEDCAESFNSVFEAVTLQGWNNVLSNFAKMGTDMMSSFSGLANAAVPLANLISPEFGAGFGIFAGILGPLTSMFGQVMSTISSLADQIIKKIYDTIMDFVNGLWSRRKEIGKGLQKVWNGVMDGLDFGTRLQNNTMWKNTQKTFNDIMSMFGWDLRMGVDGAFSSAADQAARSMHGKALDIAYSMVDGVVTGLKKQKGALADESAWASITQGLFGKKGVVTIVGEELLKALMPDGILEDLALWVWGSIMHVFTLRPSEVLDALHGAGEWLINMFIPPGGLHDHMMDMWSRLTGPDGFFAWVMSPAAWPRISSMWDTLLDALFPSEWPGLYAWAGKAIGVIAGALLGWPLALFGDMTGIFSKMFSESKINWSYIFSWAFFKDFWDAFTGGISSFFKSMWNGFWEMIGDITGMWSDGLESTINVETREHVIGTAYGLIEPDTSSFGMGDSAFDGASGFSSPSPFAGLAEVISRGVSRAQGLAMHTQDRQNGSETKPTVVYNQYNESPQALDEAAIYRQTNSLLRSRYAQ
jgi:hypothetical protein